MKNDTPRTDAVLNTFNGKASKLAADLATHAEELERELAAVTKERDKAWERIKNNPWCEACLETDCCVSGDGTCAMIRKYLSNQ